MDITWLGTASILIKSKDTVLLFDPFFGSFREDGVSFPLEILPLVQAIFITHPHLDHFCNIDTILKQSTAPVYVCRRGIEIARHHELETDRFREVQNGSTITLPDLKIQTYQSCHCRFDKTTVRETLHKALKPEHLTQALQIEKLNRQYRIDAENDVFAYKIQADGRTLFLMGTANLREDISYPQHMDLLIFPYQGRSDMADYSLSLFEKLKPQAVLLDHFDDAFPPISCAMDCSEVIRLAARHFPDMKIFQPKPLETYHLN